jgi:DNA-binding NarL/FixJ family response regulator
MSPECRALMLESFPHCILYTPTMENRGTTSYLCGKLGKVVVFNYMPNMLPHMWLRTSAVFNQKLVKVIGLHPHVDDRILDVALATEFAGVLGCDAKPEAMRRAVAAVHRGELWYPRLYISDKLRQTISQTSAGSLSDRESDILDLLAQGDTNKAIAEKLAITRGTVRWHLRSIYSKLGVSDREAAFRLAKNRAPGQPSAAE